MASIRLSKRMAELGLCSRREADFYIERGWVKVNGEVALLGQKVLNKDSIDLQAQVYKQQAARVTILLNKPVGYVSAQAEHGYQSSASLITAENHWKDDPSTIHFIARHGWNLAPAGRLDIDSTGLLVLTQDGRVAKRIIGETVAIDKEYLVRVTGSLNDVGLKLLNHGLSLDGRVLRKAKVVWQNQNQLRFTLHEGKKRQIRRMCEQVGLQVVGLKRIRIGNIKLGALPQGQWRYLRAEESF